MTQLNEEEVQVLQLVIAKRGRAPKSWKLKISILFLALYVFHIPEAVAYEGAVPAASIECSTYDAVYKPTTANYPSVPAAKENVELEFTLTIHEPLGGEKGGSHRTRFFYFDAYDKETGKKLSTLRMADVCSNGVVRCGISTYEGQFRKNDEMKDLEFGIGFDPIALRSDFSRTKYWDSKAPYAYIFPDTLIAFHYLKNKLKLHAKEKSVAADTLVSDFVKFHSPQHALPDFGGKDVWLLDHCAESSKD